MPDVVYYRFILAHKSRLPLSPIPLSWAPEAPIALSTKKDEVRFDVGLVPNLYCFFRRRSCWQHEMPFAIPGHSWLDRWFPIDTVVSSLTRPATSEETSSLPYPALFTLAGGHMSARI